MVVPMAPIGLILILALMLYLILTYFYVKKIKRFKFFLVQFGNIFLFLLTCSIYFMLINFLYDFDIGFLDDCFICGILFQLLFFLVFSLIYSYFFAFLFSRFLEEDLKKIYFILFLLPLSFMFLFVLFFIIYSFKGSQMI